MQLKTKSTQIKKPFIRRRKSFLIIIFIILFTNYRHQRIISVNDLLDPIKYLLLIIFLHVPIHEHFLNFLCMTVNTIFYFHVDEKIRGQIDLQGRMRHINASSAGNQRFGSNGPFQRKLLRNFIRKSSTPFALEVGPLAN